MSITHYIVQPWIHAIGWSILHSMWQFLLIAVMWKMALYLSRNNSSVLRYRFSLAALIALPLTFIVTFIKQWSIYANASRVVSINYTNKIPFPQSIEKPYFVIEKSYISFFERYESLTPLVFWIYLSGILFFSIKTILNYYRINALKSNHSGPLSPEWEKRVGVILKKIGIHIPIPVFFSQKISSPVVIGYLKPLVLIPAAMLTSLSPMQVEAILMHEFYHIRMKDHYINLMQHLIEILFFFHPAVWWISKGLRMERERRVDERVVEFTGDPQLYAHALIKLEEARTFILQPVLAAKGSTNNLFIRIKNIMNMKSNRLNASQLFSTAIIFALAVISLILLHPKASARSEVPEKLASATAIDHSNEVLKELNVGKTDMLSSPKVFNNSVLIELENGMTIPLDSISPEDQEEIRIAMEEARIEMERARIEMKEEIRKEMEQLKEELKLARIEMQKELEKINSEESREKMKREMEEAKASMEEARKAMQETWNSEEFRKSMQMNSVEAQKALQEAAEAMNSEEVQKAFQEAAKVMQSEEVKNAFEEATKALQSDEVQQAFSEGMKGLAQAMESLGETFRDPELMNDIQKTMEEVMKSMEFTFETEKSPSSSKPATAPAAKGSEKDKDKEMEEKLESLED
jgi:bla regulator protein blaR1